MEMSVFMYKFENSQRYIPLSSSLNQGSLFTPNKKRITFNKVTLMLTFNICFLLENCSQTGVLSLADIKIMLW